MHTNNLLITINWKDINEAEKLGITIPKSETKKTEMLFWKRDVKKVIINGIDNSILIEFNDESSHELAYDKKLWEELKTFFKDNEE